MLYTYRVDKTKFNETKAIYAKWPVNRWGLFYSSWGPHTVWYFGCCVSTLLATKPTEQKQWSQNTHHEEHWHQASHQTAN